MRVLLCELFISYTAKSIKNALNNLGVDCIIKTYYTPEDLIEDRRIDNMILKDIKQFHPDAVMSVNFWPPISRVCNRKNIKYISYGYDSPQDIPKSETGPMSYIFSFDKVEVQSLIKEGYENVFHSPLATDINAWDSIEKGAFEYDISLIGNLYKSNFFSLMSGLDEYHQGFLRGVISAQQGLYGYYLVKDVIKDKISGINECYKVKGLNLSITTPQLSYAMGSYINYLDRVSLLRLLNSTGNVHLFTKELDPDDKSLLSSINIHKEVDYMTQMPLIFKKTKINLNPTSRVICSGIPQRVLDVLGCKGFVLSSFQPEIAEYFIPNEEVVLYDSYEDAVEKSDYYMKNDSLREHITINGYEKVKEYFTYESRLKDIFEIAKVTI